MQGARTRPPAWRRLGRQAARDPLPLAGLGLALMLGIVANGALHAGNYDAAARGSGSGLIGLLAASQAIGIMLAAPLHALLTARLPRANLAVASGALTATGLAAVFASSAIAAELAGRVLLGCGIGLGMAFTEFVVITRARRPLRAIFATGFGLVLTLGHTLGTLLTPVAHLPAVALTLAATVLAASLALARWGRVPAEQTPAGLREMGRVVAMSPAIFLSAALFGFLDNGFLSMLPDYFSSAGLARDDLVMTSFAAFAGIFVFQLPASILSTRMDPALLLRAVVLALVVGVAAAGIAVHDPHLRLVTVFVLGGLVDIIYTVGLLSLAGAIPRHSMAAANACFISFCGLGEVTGPLATGPALQWGGLGGGIAIVLYLLAAFWIATALASLRGQTGLGIRALSAERTA